MFTGIVTAIGTVTQARKMGPSLKRLAISCPWEAEGIEIGASIACAGVCLTVTALSPREDGEPGCVFQVEAAAETLSKTLVGDWDVGTPINLERSLKMGDELGGHMVSGHVDGVAELVTREDLPDMAKLTFRVPTALARFIAPKGSVALDGVSLTVNTVEGDRFSVLIIPHTLAVTTFGALRAGDRINLEIDQMARYAIRWLETRD